MVAEPAGEGRGQVFGVGEGLEPDGGVVDAVDAILGLRRDEGGVEGVAAHIQDVTMAGAAAELAEGGGTPEKIAEAPEVGAIAAWQVDGGLRPSMDDGFHSTNSGGRCSDSIGNDAQCPCGRGAAPGLSHLAED